MKTNVLLIAFLACAISLGAQEQPGVVKTIGRPGQPGQPLEDVAIRVHGNESLSVSGEDGSFYLSLAHYSSGQAYSLKTVFKSGYQLADAAVIGRRYPFSSDIPLEISMMSKEYYTKVKAEIEAQIRAKVYAEYESRMSELQKNLDNQVISSEAYREQINLLVNYYDNVDNLVSALADRYARTDYDMIDSLDQVINHLIEQGRIEEAEVLIDEKDTKRELEQIRTNNRILAKTLEEGREAEALKVREYAHDLFKKYEIASLRFDNKAAANHLKERMELDSANVDWKLDYAAFIRDYLGNYDEAMSIYQWALNKGVDTSVQAELYGCIGGIYSTLGQFDSALEYYMKSAALRESDLSLRERLATNYYNIGATYLDKEMYDDAVVYLDKAKALNHEYGDSLGVASVYSSMAVMWHDKGDFAQAEENLQRALNIRLEVSGENDLSVASLYASLAMYAKDMDRLSAAREYLEKAMAIHVRLLGTHHPEVADDYLLLGALEVSFGNNSNALRYYEEAIEVMMEYYPGAHPDIAQAYNNLASYYRNITNEKQKALYYYDQSYAMMVSIYGKVHSEVSTALNNLAIVYSELAQYDKSLQCYNEALDIIVSLYGEKHYHVGANYANCATLYNKIGNIEQARIYTEKALPIFIDYYGERHSTVAFAYNNLGALYADLGMNQAAFDNYAKAISIYKDIYGEDHMSLVSPYNNMGALYATLKKYDEAEFYVAEALRIILNTNGERHDDVAISYNTLSQIYLAKKDYPKAEAFLLKTKDIMSEIYGPRHPNVATALSNLSVLYRNINNLDKTLECSLQALSIVEEIYQYDHPTVMLYRYGVANTYFEAGRNEQAIPYLTEVYRDSYEKAGPDDRYTAHYFMYLHQMYTGAQGSASYDGSLDESYAELSRNTIITARVVDGGPAAQRGLQGTYYVMSYEDWTLADEEKNFFAYNISVSDRAVKTYVLYRDGEFIKVPFEGTLGIRLEPKWISSEEKTALIKSFKKWSRKNR